MTEQHELDGPQPFLAYVKCRPSEPHCGEPYWAIAWNVSADTEWCCDDDGRRVLFSSLASARAYANERGWE